MWYRQESIEGKNGEEATISTREGRHNLTLGMGNWLAGTTFFSFVTSCPGLLLHDDTGDLVNWLVVRGALGWLLWLICVLLLLLPIANATLILRLLLELVVTALLAWLDRRH